MGEFPMIRSVIGISLCACLLLAKADGAGAETYPSHPIRVIVPFPAGGGVDTIARILQPKLQEILGQPLVIEDRPGASAIVGTEVVAKAPPDGYTLLFTLDPFVVNAFIYKDLPYDPLRDFAPVALIATTPYIMVVNPQVKAKSVQEVIDTAKAQPGTLNYGTAGIGSPFNLAGALFNSVAGVNIVAVSYPGGPQATLGLISGQVQVLFGNLFNIAPYLKSGQMRALAVTSAKRLPDLPDLPTISEAGVPGYEFSSWFGVLVPQATPDDTVRRLNAAVNEAIGSPDVKKQIAAQSAEVVGGSSQAFADFLKKEMNRWSAVIPKTQLKSP